MIIKPLTKGWWKKDMESTIPNVEDIYLKKVTTYDKLVFYIDNQMNIYNQQMKLLKQKINNKGYLQVTTRKTWGARSQANRLVHRIIAQAFIKPDLDDRYEVHHKDHNPLNNSIDNLEPMLRHDHKIEHLQKYPLVKICEVCGNEYIPKPTKRNRSHTCSNECKIQLDKIHAAKRKRPIGQYDTNHIFLKTWDSARDIQNELGFRESNINKCCNHNINSAYGYIWEYV